MNYKKLYDNLIENAKQRTNIGTCIDIIDGVVWKLGWGDGGYELTRVGKLNEKA